MPTCLARGPRPVFAATEIDGDEPIVEFLDSLEPKKRLRLLRPLERLAVGLRLSREDFRKLRGEIFEVKDHQARMLCFTTSDGWFVTHGFSKKTNRPTPRREIERAERIRREHLQRQGRAGK